jgi:hypothetical protein
MSLDAPVCGREGEGVCAIEDEGLRVGGGERDDVEEGGEMRRCRREVERMRISRREMGCTQGESL